MEGLNFREIVLWLLMAGWVMSDTQRFKDFLDSPQGITARMAGLIREADKPEPEPRKKKKGGKRNE